MFKNFRNHSNTFGTNLDCKEPVMNLFKTNKMKISALSIFAAFAVITLIGSCNLNNNNSTNAPGSTFLVANLCPDAPQTGFDVYVNGIIAKNNLFYTNSTYYATTAPGNYRVQLDAGGTSSGILDSTFALVANTAYSIYAIDSLSKLQMTLVNDNLTPPTTDSVKIRFLDFSPNDTSTVALSSGTILFQSRTFNDQAANPVYTVFQTIPAGSYTFQLKVPNSATIKLALPAMTLIGGHIYTFDIQGFAGGTGAQAYNLGSIQNL